MLCNNLINLIKYLDKKDKIYSITKNGKSITIDSIDLNIKINSISTNSQTTAKHDIFIAIEGIYKDGHKFIAQAITMGSSVIIIEKEDYIDYSDNTERLFILVKSTKKALALISKCYYNHPDNKLNIIGITGTNGKSTTSYILSKILQDASYKTSVIGTINYIIGDEILESNLTTPTPPELYSLMYKMVKVDIKYLIIEVSSHALKMDRVYGMNINSMIFTNMTSDHLDYHNTIDDYLKSKLISLDILLHSNKKNKNLIINYDDKYSKHFISKAINLGIKYETYGIINNKSNLIAKNINISLTSSIFNTIYNNSNWRYKITSNLTGRFNIYNILSSILLCKNENISISYIANSLKSIEVEGRFNIYKKGMSYSIIDYAHTSDALKNVLQTIRHLNKKNIYKIITIFGCGGDRDKSKRPIMYNIANYYSNEVIITNDNPRNENDILIMFDIIKMSKYNKKVSVILDRSEAIKSTISRHSLRNSIILIAGKGHEKFQLISNRKIYLSDIEIVNSIKIS